MTDGQRLGATLALDRLGKKKKSFVFLWKDFRCMCTYNPSHDGRDFFVHPPVFCLPGSSFSFQNSSNHQFLGREALISSSVK